MKIAIFQFSGDGKQVINFMWAYEYPYTFKSMYKPATKYKTRSQGFYLFLEIRLRYTKLD